MKNRIKPYTQSWSEWAKSKILKDEKALLLHEVKQSCEKLLAMFAKTPTSICEEIITSYDRFFDALSFEDKFGTLNSEELRPGEFRIMPAVQPDEMRWAIQEIFHAANHLEMEPQANILQHRLRLGAYKIVPHLYIEPDPAAPKQPNPLDILVNVAGRLNFAKHAWDRRTKDRETQEQQGDWKDHYEEGNIGLLDSPANPLFHEVGDSGEYPFSFLSDQLILLRDLADEYATRLNKLEKIEYNEKQEIRKR